MFSVIAMNFFKLEAEQNGYLMAYFGVMQMVSSELHLTLHECVLQKQQIVMMCCRKDNWQKKYWCQAVAFLTTFHSGLTHAE